MNLALQLGMSSEPNLALAHSHNFSEYMFLSKLFDTARQEYDHRELLSLMLLHNDHGND